MRKSFTRKLSLAVLGLLPFAALHAQTLDPQLALEKAQATREQWAGPGYTAADMRVSSAYAEANGLEHVYMQQVYLGIPIYNQMQSLAFMRGRLAVHTGSFVPAKQLAALSATPGIMAAAAVSRALQHVRGIDTGTPTRLTAEGGPEARQTFDKSDVARHDIVASLTWAFDDSQRPHLTWNVNVDLVDAPDWWNIRIDAQTGAVVDQDNWTTHEAAIARPAAPQAAPAQGYQALNALLALAPPPPPTTTTSSYLVLPFPLERPSATNTGFQVDTDPWLRAGATNNAVTYGWHFDGTTNYTTTRGNNVAAYEDGASTNAPGTFAPSLTAAPALNFAYQPDFTLNTTATLNRNAAITNLFYWNNIIHDLTYQYGFTEVAGNFQNDNQGRGGVGSDYVRAEAQDGSGLNNANFSTPTDGSSGRMQMYLWNPATPAYTITVTAPTAVAGSYTAVEGRISANNRLSAVGPVSGQLALYTDAVGSSQGCAAYSATTPLTGKIALLYRGGAAACTFPVKVKNAQLAGAIGVIVVNNVATAPVTMFGTDNTITIPAVMVSQANGATLAAQVANGVQVTMPLNANTVQRDGDFDNGVMVHEYGHGISGRLTGGPANSSCLDNAEQGGEGWSDYLALMMTTNWATAQLTDGPNARPVGTYVVFQAPTAGGIRRYPYSTSMTIDPLTYANVATSPEVHNIGEVWCSALWDMTWNVIQQKGNIQANLYNTNDPGGNVIALQLMMQGLKLQPCRPGFLDARDAILAADSLLYQGQYHCAIWSAFARRGMGYSAQQGSSDSATDQVPAFDLPPAVILDKQDALRAGTTFSMAFRLSCGCPSTATAAYTLTDELPAGLQFVSSNTGGTLVGNKVTFSNLSFTAPGQSRTVGFQAQATASATCPIVLPVNDNRDGSLVGGFASQALTGTTTWAPSTTRAYSGTTSWFATTPVVASDFVLTSAPFTPTGLSTLSFYHYFNLEGTYDGGTVELSTNNGTTWQDAATYFVYNGYNAVFDATTTAPGQPCFSGRSSVGSSRFIHSVLDLRSFAGQPLLVRFRVRTDVGNQTTYEGWFIDDIRVLNGCGGPQLVELRTGAGTLQTAQSIFTYLLPAGTLATQAATLAAASQFLAHPNPFGTSGLQLQLTLPTTQNQVGLTLYDVAGRTLLRRTVAQAAAGTSTLSWPETASLPAGLYLLQVQLPDGSSTTLRVEHE